MRASKAAGGNLHAGHRARLRRRFLDEGLDAFEDHQVLELLLFYAIPRRDTNEIAHMLLRRHGSFSGVLDADPKDLADNPRTRPGRQEQARERILKIVAGDHSPATFVRQMLDHKLGLH